MKVSECDQAGVALGRRTEIEDAEVGLAMTEHEGEIAIAGVVRPRRTTVPHPITNERHRSLAWSAKVAVEATAVKATRLTSS